MSEVKVNKISPRTACGTVTLGDSGDTFTIPSGATINNQGTAVNFGATGSASWVTTVKTSSFTAVAGEGYFVNTTGGAVTVNLPAGVAGAVVAIKDYANTFDTNGVTLVQNGSDKIGGSTVNGILTTEGIAVTLVFVDSTQGWLVTDSGLQSEAPTAEYIVATGGTITCSGDFKIHTFTGPGSLCVSAVGNAEGSTVLEYIVAAGGGGADGNTGNTRGGGGGGGFRFASPSLAPLCYPGKPLAAPAGITAAVQSYPIVVGAGGNNSATQGSNSSSFGITSTGGGRDGGNGGSGGGGSGGSLNNPGGTGNTPPVSPSQGNNGGTSSTSSPDHGSGGGGGAIVVGANGAPPTSGIGGDGAGMPTGFGANGVSCGPFRYYAGGGGGGGNIPTSLPAGAGGKGGGGAGSQTTSTAGTVNSGGGSGGGGGGGPGNSGGSGIVVIRYKFQN